MKLFEYAGKKLFARYGIPVPCGGVAHTVDEAVEIADDIGYPVVAKVQILSGGRGKAGGIMFGSDADELRQAAAQLLGSEIRGLPVDTILVEQKLNIEREFYLGAIIDASRRCPLFIFSSHGGVDIEDVPDDQIARIPVDMCYGLSPYMFREALHQFGITGKLAAEIAGTAVKLYKLLVDEDAEMVEINPLVIADGKVLAADARCTIDDFAVYRHPDTPRTSEGSKLEQEMKAAGLAFVELDGDIAVMANGAGVTMGIIDMLSDHGGRAANFLDAGGGAGVEATARGIRALLRTDPQAILICIFGGITRCDDVARAIVQVMDSESITVPIIVRLTGINQREAAEILKPVGIVPFTELEDAVQRVVQAARGGA